MRSGAISLEGVGSALIAHCVKAGYSMTHPKSDSPLPAYGQARVQPVFMQLSADAVESGDTRRHLLHRAADLPQGAIPAPTTSNTLTGAGCGYPLDSFRPLDIIGLGASPTIRQQLHDSFDELTLCPTRTSPNSVLHRN